MMDNEKITKDIVISRIMREYNTTEEGAKEILLKLGIILYPGVELCKELLKK